MPLPGFVDLDVQYRDNNTGVGVAVDSLEGKVFNEAGHEIETVTPIPETDVTGITYWVRDLDLRNAANYPGLYVTVEWHAVHRGIALPVFPKTYGFQPTSPVAMNGTVIEWPQCTSPLAFFYEIFKRRSPDYPAWQLVGRSWGPHFVDRTVYENEFEARSWEYQIQQYTRTPGILQPDGSDYMTNGSMITPLRVWRAPTGSNADGTGFGGVCEISGKVVDLTGGPGVAYWPDMERKLPEVIFTVHPRATQQLVGSTYIMPEDVIARVALDGRFTIALLQDTIVEFRVTNTFFRGRFITPLKPKANLGEVSIEIIRDY